MLNFILSNIAYAQSEGLVTCQKNCTFCDLLATGHNIFQFIIEMSFVLVTVFIVWSAIKIMTAGGNETRLTEGRKMITTALYGLLLILTSWLIVTELLHLLSGDREHLWNKIDCYVPQTSILTSPDTKTANNNSRLPNPDSYRDVPLATCQDPAALATFYNTAYPIKEAPETSILKRCILNQLISLGKDDLVDTNKIYTYGSNGSYCNYTRGELSCPTIASCPHRVYSCHFGGRTGSQGALAIDFNAKNPSQETELYNAISQIKTEGRCLDFGQLINEGDHTHVSLSSCQ